MNSHSSFVPSFLSGLKTRLARPISPTIANGSIAILAMARAAGAGAECRALAGPLHERGGGGDITPGGLRGRGGSGHGEVGERGEEEGEGGGELHFCGFGWFGLGWLVELSGLELC